jgi:hypothetical protein
MKIAIASLFMQFIMPSPAGTEIQVKKMFDGRASRAQKILFFRKYNKIMKTWRQGIIGKLDLNNSKILFTKCLKYPLLFLYDNYHIESKKLSNYLFKAFIDLDVLKQIEMLDYVPLSKEEKNLGNQFEMEYKPGTIEIAKIKYNSVQIMNEIVKKNKEMPCSFDELSKKYQSI